MTARTPGRDWLLLQQLDDGQDKRERLAGAGLRRGDQVVSGERRLDGLRLHGRRVGKAVLCEVALQKSGEREFREIFHL